MQWGLEKDGLYMDLWIRAIAAVGVGTLGITCATQLQMHAQREMGILNSHQAYKSYI